MSIPTPEMNDSSGPSAAGDAAARVCLDILRGAAQLAQPYAFHLCKLLREEGRRGELPWVEALSGCLAEVVAAARAGDDASQDKGQVRASESDDKTTVRLDTIG
jgi:hypothetical protein